jgi:UDP-glucuronate 4-epimerase
MNIVVTGAAGFIGFHVARALLQRGDQVLGVDSINDYYDPSIKHARLGLLRAFPRFSLVHGNLADPEVVGKAFAVRPDRVIHLAAQAGVRYSRVNPMAYVESNLVAFTRILEACRHSQVAHLSYASTSSVYGANACMPFSERHGADHPLQFYAATKRANELMAHSYSDLFGLPTTGLRFFTVYGPWGRPDMALFLFTRNMLEGRPIQVFNYGRHTRDFTYVDDIVEGVIRASDRIASPNPDWDAHNPDPASSRAPFRIYNIGNSTPVPLVAYIEAIEKALGVKAIQEHLPLQAGDVPDTFADVGALAAEVGYRPSTPVQEGVGRFVDWYRTYYCL